MTQIKVTETAGYRVKAEVTDENREDLERESGKLLEAGMATTWSVQGLMQARLIVARLAELGIPSQMTMGRTTWTPVDLTRSNSEANQ